MIRQNHHRAQGRYGNDIAVLGLANSQRNSTLLKILFQIRWRLKSASLTCLAKVDSYFGAEVRSRGWGFVGKLNLQRLADNPVGASPKS